MTIGERNKNFIRLQENGMTIKEACSILGMNETTGQKISSQYRQGEDVFSSEREWTPETEVKINVDERTSVASIREQELMIPTIGHMSNIDLLKMTIRVGDKVKIYRDTVQSATVCKVHPFVVFCRKLKNPPCDKCYKADGCKVKGTCKNTYDEKWLLTMCKDYYEWFVRTEKFSPQYSDLVEGMEE